jgi:hypothetical protein
MGNSFVVFIDPNYDTSTRRQIGEAIVSYVVDRTQSGKGIDGESFGKYADTYKSTDEFKIAKSGESKVNLTLTGEMLSTLRVLDIGTPGRIEIGYNDGEESDKSVWMKEKGYDFMGVSDRELESILADFEPNVSFGDVIRELLEVDEN